VCVCVCACVCVCVSARARVGVCHTHTHTHTHTHSHTHTHTRHKRTHTPCQLSKPHGPPLRHIHHSLDLCVRRLWSSCRCPPRPPYHHAHWLTRQWWHLPYHCRPRPLQKQHIHKCTRNTHERYTQARRER